MHGCAWTISGLSKSLAASEGQWSLAHVMTAASIGATKAGGYARYLESKTVEHDRGDYYLTQPASRPRRRDAGLPVSTRSRVSASRESRWRVLSSSP